VRGRRLAAGRVLWVLAGGIRATGNGGAERNRTADLLIANEALSQLSYGPGALRAKRAGGRLLGGGGQGVKRSVEARKALLEPFSRALYMSVMSFGRRASGALLQAALRASA
jgi:hypothetical protein